MLGHQHAAKCKGGGLIRVFLHRFPCVKQPFPRPQGFRGDEVCLQCSIKDVWMHDTDEGITVLPIHLSGVKSDANVGRNSVYS